MEFSRSPKVGASPSTRATLWRGRVPPSVRLGIAEPPAQREWLPPGRHARAGIRVPHEALGRLNLDGQDVVAVTGHSDRGAVVEAVARHHGLEGSLPPPA